MNTPVPLSSAEAAWPQYGELGLYVPSYRRRLEEGRYAISSRQVYLRCLAHFGHWLTAERRPVGDLCDSDLGRFLDVHLPNCSCPMPVRHSRHDNRAALRLLLRVLADAQVSTPRHRTPDGIEVELRRFDDHMVHQRGLASNTRYQRLHIVRAFLRQRSDGAGSELAPICAADLRRFINDTLERWSPASARTLAGTLRSYLRFRALSGDRVDHLLPVIASPACWRLAALPEMLSEEEVAQVLAFRSPHRHSTCRAHAMIRCMTDLGLRAHEVTSLNLEDIDWSTGTLRIGPTKSRRVDMMPLPTATGSAMATYLRVERPATPCRRVFVRHVAPVGEPIGPGVARRAMSEAYRDCGLPHTRVHVLRHSLASRLLGGGATLKEVADVLRHRQLDTTLYYAKIDIAHLSSVALDWPGGVS